MPISPARLFIIETKFFNIAAERYRGNIRSIITGLQKHSVNKTLKG